MSMFDSISNVNDYLSEHWLAEVFPAKLKDLATTWKELASKGKATPVRGLVSLNGEYLTMLASLPQSTRPDFATPSPKLTKHCYGQSDSTPPRQSWKPAKLKPPSMFHCWEDLPSTTTSDALHILQAVPVDTADALLGEDTDLLYPVTLAVTSAKIERLTSVSGTAITRLLPSATTRRATCWSSPAELFSSPTPPGGRKADTWLSTSPPPSTVEMTRRPENSRHTRGSGRQVYCCPTTTARQHLTASPRIRKSTP